MEARFSNRAYFFDQGLCFACLRCGACCTGAPGTIYVGPGEIALIADLLKLPLAVFMDRYLYPFKESFSIREDSLGNCLFFKNGCAIYAVRPLQCRTFPFWFDNLRSETRWLETARRCPGIGQGRRYRKDELVEMARGTMMI
jgi:uncharacterized protein